MEHPEDKLEKVFRIISHYSRRINLDNCSSSENAIHRKYLRMLSFLAQLEDDFGIDMSESIRNGVALFFIAKVEEKMGRKLAFVNETGKITGEVIL